jgi:hypothetical protein
MRLRSIGLVLLLGPVVAAAVAFVLLRGGGEEGIGSAAAVPASPESYAANILARERAGEWTRGEGLLQTLKLFNGDLEPSALVEGEIEELSGTGVIRLAEEYLAGPEEELKAEVQAELDRAVVTLDEARAMAGETAVALSTRGGVAARPNLEGTEVACEAMFGELEPQDGPCLVLQTWEAGGHVHQMYGPAEGYDQAGWTVAHYEAVRAGVSDSVVAYQQFGEMMPIFVVFGNFSDGDVNGFATGGQDGPCGVLLHPALQQNSAERFLAIVAHEIAHCFSARNFKAANAAGYDAVMWREEGLAEWMPNLPYPENDTQFERLPNLTAREHDTSLFDRAYTNFVWFQFLANEMGPGPMIEFLKSFPAGGTREQAEAMAAYPGMAEMFHRYAKQFYDGEIADSGGALIPTSTSTPVVTLDATEDPIADEPIHPFQVRRRELSIPEKKKAEITYSFEGSVMSALRDAAGGEWRQIPSRLPEGDPCEEAHYVALVTAVDYDATWHLGAPEVEDADEEIDCEKCVLGRWSLDMSTFESELMADAPADFSLAWKEGGIWATFTRDGKVSFEIDYEATAHQAMTDAYGNDMGIGHGGFMYGSGSTTWESAEGRLRFAEGSFAVSMRFATSIKGKVMKGEPIDVSAGYTPGGMRGDVSYECDESTLRIRGTSSTYTWNRD